MINPCQTCCYIISDESGECVIIDPCAYYERERERIVNYIESEKLQPVRCLLTHAHFDHLLSVDLIYEKYDLLPEVHHDDEPSMHRVRQRIIEVFGESNFTRDIPMPEHWLNDGDIIPFGSHYLSVIHTPGHSPGSVVYYCEDEHLAFTGDTLFYNNVGRTDLYGGDKEAYKKSLLKIMELPEETIIQSGHSKKTTIEREKLRNPYIIDLLKNEF